MSLRGIALGGLGALTQEQVMRANAQLEILLERVGRQNEILNIAQHQGFDGNLLAELQAVHGTLVNELDSLAAQLPSLSTTGFEEWLERLQSVDTRVGSLERLTQERLGADEPSRLARISLATVGAIAAVGLVGGLIWYASGQARRTRRRRRHRPGRGYRRWR